MPADDAPRLENHELCGIELNSWDTDDADVPEDTPEAVALGTTSGW